MAQAKRVPVLVDDASAAAPPPSELFQGYDSVTGVGLSTAVQGNTTTIGARSEVRYRVCLDISELVEVLEISQSLSVGYGPIFSASEKLQFLKSLKVTTYSLSMIVYARNVVGTDKTTDYALKNSISPPRTTSELKKFFDDYGDSALVSVTRGAEYFAVYTFYSQTREEKEQLIIDLKAQGLYNGISVGAELQTKLDRFTSSTKTRIAFDQKMFGISRSYPNPSKITEFALEFPGLPLTKPEIMAFDTIGYERVRGVGDAFKTIAANREFFIGANGIAPKLVKVQELENQIALIQDIYRFYGSFTDSKLNDAAGKAKSDHDTIDALIKRYEEDPAQSFSTPDLPSLRLGTPSLNCDIKVTPGYGGGGGYPFDDLDFSTAVATQTRITKLQLRSGEVIDSLIVTYTNLEKSWTYAHGGDGGALGNVLQLPGGQFITRVSGRSGSLVDKLRFEIANGNSIEGGRDGGAAFPDWKPQDGSFLLGFAGRSNKKLDQIKLVYGKFADAKWK
jgi:hypothetical protein